MFVVTGKPIPGSRCRGNTTMALPPYLYPYNKLDYLEYLSEQKQDDARDGFINMGSDNSFYFSGSTNQSVNGQAGADFITIEGSSRDTVFGGSGNDNIDTGAGNDTINGQEGEDHIFGGAGADRISGGSDNDYLVGDNDAVASSQHGIDTMFGGSGRDTLYGGG